MVGVATKAIIFNEKGEVLLLNKSETEEINPNTVDIPGGRLEFAEKPEDGLHREIMEEVGLEIDILGPSRVWSMVKKELHLVGITFAALLKKDSGVALSHEHTGHFWVPAKEIDSGDYPSWIKEEVAAASKVASK